MKIRNAWYCRITPFTILIPLVSCAPQPPVATYEPPPDRSYEASFDEVWGAVIETFTDLEIPIENIETESGFIRSGPIPWSGSDIAYFDCGKVWKGAVSGGWSAPENARFRVTVLVRDRDDGVSVRLREAAEATYEGKALNCVPTGAMSGVFYAQLEKRFAGSH